MGDDREWQKQLATAALMAAARTAVQYITNPESRDVVMDDVKSKLSEVDYGAAARAVSEVIDRVADSAKVAINEAIDSIRENAEDAVEMAAERAQEQLGPARKRGKGRLFLGILMGVGLGFVLLNEDRRNQLMDKLTGASGPIDSAQWSTVATADNGSSAVTTGAPASVSSPTESFQTIPEPEPVASQPVVPEPMAEVENAPSTKARTRKAKTEDGAETTKSDA